MRGSDSLGPEHCLDGAARVFARREEKYEIDRETITGLEERIAAHLPVYCYRREQPRTYITTVYFDTRNRDFFRRAERDYDDNVKIRVREYSYPAPGSNDAGGCNGSAAAAGGTAYLTMAHCFVELKERREGTVVKKRFAVPKTELLGLFRGQDLWNVLLEVNPPQEHSALRDAYSDLLRYLKKYSFEATSVVNYRRTVYQKDENDLRITLDDLLAVYPPLDGLYTQVDALTPETLGVPIRKSRRVILEIKCPGAYPQWLREALGPCRSKRLSKFTTSVRLLLRKDGEGAPQLS